MAQPLLSPASTIILDSPLPPIDHLPKLSVWHFLHKLCDDSDADKVAYVDEATGEELSLRDVFRQSQCVGFVLLHRLGLAPGDTVIIFSENTTKYPVVVLGLQAAGIICSPASAAHQAKELTYQITDSQAKLVLASKRTYPTALSACKDAGITAPILIEGGSPRDSSLGGESLWDMVDNNRKIDAVNMSSQQAVETTTLLCYSSGTSGLPKGAKMSHYNLTSALLQAQRMSPGSYGSQETWIACLPLSHMYGLFMHVYMSAFTKAKVIVMSKFVLESYAAAIQRYSVTAGHIVPPMAIRLAKDFKSEFDLSSLKEWRSAAAPLGQEAEELLHRKFGVPLHSIYAMTETTAIIAHTCRDATIKPGSVGRLGPNMSAKIVDGELRIKGPNIMIGYHNRVDVNKETFDEEGFMRTGDVVRVDKDGHIFVIDRVKELIKYNGYQVPPAELEDILLSHKEVSDAAVVGIADLSAGTEYPTAFVALREPTTPERDIKKLRVSLLEYVSKQVAHYKYLRGGIVFASSIPKSASGKILRQVLRNYATKHRERLVANLEQGVVSITD